MDNAVATLNGTKMLGQLQELGTIEEGKLADMVLLDKNPLETIQDTRSIHIVIKIGSIQQRAPKNRK